MSSLERLAARVRRARELSRTLALSQRERERGEGGERGAAEQETGLAVLRAQLEALWGELAEVKDRVNGLLWAVVAAVMLDLVQGVLK